MLRCRSSWERTKDISIPETDRYDTRHVNDFTTKIVQRRQACGGRSASVDEDAVAAKGGRKRWSAATHCDMTALGDVGSGESIDHDAAQTAPAERHLSDALASRGFGARISAWRHFKGCRADVYRGDHGGLSCRSSLIPRAVIIFPVSGIG